MAHYVKKNGVATLLGAAPAPAIISGTLAAGSTAVTFTDASITTDSIIDPYQYVTPGSTVSIIAPTQIVQSNGSCTLIFDAQESAVTVGIRVF